MATIVNHNPVYMSGNSHMQQGDQYPVQRLDPKEDFVKALRYDGMHDRARQLSLPIIPLESFDWIWDTPFAKWLVETGNIANPCFWILGKPGSGKSTLMKYITDSYQTTQLLEDSIGSDFAILKFFFDFRAGDSASNHETGLMKSFINQLYLHFPELERSFLTQHVHDPVQERSPDRLYDMLRNALKSLKTKVYAFIDGLDEYVGNHARLAELFLQLQQESNIKICFASRPEFSFVRVFQDLPRLVMQEHNLASIRIYLNHAIESARDNLQNVETVIDTSMRNRIADRANGMIIWARLVIDEMIAEARTNSERAHLMYILEGLPEDLETMYDHIFTRIKHGWQGEAALLLYLIKGFGGAIGVEMLYGLWYFCIANVLGQTPSLDVEDEDQFISRMLLLCSSFVDLLDDSEYAVAPSRHTFFSWRKKRPTDEVRIGKARWKVRLIHKTLDPYIGRSQRVISSLPEEITLRYGSKSVRTPVFADVIKTAAKHPAFNSAAIEDCVVRWAQRKSSQLRDSYEDWFESLADNLQWGAQWRLLVLSCQYFSYESAELGTDTPEAWVTTLDSPLIKYKIWKPSLPQAFTYHPPSEAIAQTDVSEVGQALYLYALIRTGVGYCLRAAQEIIAGLPSYWCEWLLAFTIGDVQAAEDSEGALYELSCLLQRRCLKVDVICHLKALGFLLLRAGHMDQHRQLRLSARHLPVVNDYFHCHCGRRLHPLFAWMQGMGEISTEAPGVFVNSETSSDGLVVAGIYEPDRQLLIFVLKMLFRNGTSIKESCPGEGTILHHLCNQVQGQDRLFGSLALSLLILFAKLGADPNCKFQGQTPLQTLKAWEFRHMLKRGKKALTDIDVKCRRGMRQILKYHKKHGRWPDFEPIINECNLQWRFFDYVNDEGDIILGPEWDPPTDSDVLIDPSLHADPAPSTNPDAPASPNPSTNPDPHAD